MELSNNHYDHFEVFYDKTGRCYERNVGRPCPRLVIENLKVIVMGVAMELSNNGVLKPVYNFGIFPTPSTKTLMISCRHMAKNVNPLSRLLCLQKLTSHPGKHVSWVGKVHEYEEVV